MNSTIIPLSSLPIGKKARVKSIITNGAQRRRLLDLGLIADTEVEALQKSPAGDPIAYRIRGAVIAFRTEDASGILVEAL